MEDIELILGNSNKRFSGVTSTMLQVLPHQQEIMPLAVLGKHHLPENVPCLTFKQFVKICKNPLADGKSRVFHARRNDEMIQALLAKKLGAKIKIVFTSTAQRHHSRFTRMLMSKMDGIITTCTAAGSYLKRPADVIIPHGIDLDTYTPPSDKVKAWSELGFPGKYGIGIFGRIRPSKGIDLLVDGAIPVLKKHPDATVIICGETTPKFQSYEQELKQKINEVGLQDRFIFIGKRPFSELPSLFQGMSIVTALSRNEGFGLTVLEAMASGTAVLASEAGAWKDIIRNETDGYCVPIEDKDAITEKLSLMLSQPNKLLEMGMNGRQHVEANYSNKNEARALCDYFRSLQSN